MGLFERAYETYVNHQYYVGKYSASDGTMFKEPLAPVGHIVTKAQILITIDNEGHFVSAKKIGADEPKIVIPVSEESAGRSSGIAAHPLCDNLKYISSQNKGRHSAYISGLSEWANSEYSHPFLLPILTYVKRDTVIKDLEESQIAAKDSDTICWAVLGSTEPIECWKNTELFEAYSKYYLSKKAGEDSVVCMLTGEVSPKAAQHIKGICSANGNAKLISANDTVNFTYRGRFYDDEQALTIGYEASQKAHNALKWVVANQGHVQDGRAFICWNPKGKKLPPVFDPLMRMSTGKEKVAIDNYQKELTYLLLSYRKDLKVDDSVVIAAFDAATTGRLAVTCYNEMAAGDFLDRLEKWDRECCFTYTGDNVSSPSLYQIVNLAYGTDRNGKVETDPKFLKQQLQRIFNCKITGTHMPFDIMHSIALKTMDPMAYKSKAKSSQDANNNDVIRKLQFTACAVIRKYYIDTYKEEYKMALEKDRKDISYQYGRLLAVLEKAESDTYDAVNARDTNAMRLQSAFCAHPAQTAKVMIEQVKVGYYPKLKPASKVFYDRLIGEIYENISNFDESKWNAPLKETYIMGYYLQKNALYTKKENDNINAEDENNE